MAYSTADAYVRALEAHASAAVSARLVSDIDADLNRAETLRAADTLTNVDVLRLQSAKAAAEQTSVRSDTSQTSSLAKLAVTIGLHDGDVVDISDDLPAQPPALAMTLDAAINRAVSARPELRAATERIAASRNIATSKWEQYVPAINGDRRLAAHDRPRAVPAGERGVHRATAPVEGLGLGQHPRRVKEAARTRTRPGRRRLARRPRPPRGAPHAGSKRRPGSRTLRPHRRSCRAPRRRIGCRR